MQVQRNHTTASEILIRKKLHDFASIKEIDMVEVLTKIRKSKEKASGPPDVQIT
ncbi:hypothetical protein KFK09_003414 [Dendrobium nobile]|uniref:Uncharacterized protein n=1 Tax=Dendrobium nobile TaxID=94219 RepID=A0A8T3C177_DENNO|nr:hypothetical protein KFK09_003414 [Dendrobium nobile]